MILRKFRKIFEKKNDFWGGDGPSNRFFERSPTLPNFWRLDPDRTGQGLQFAPSGVLRVA